MGKQSEFSQRGRVIGLVAATCLALTLTLGAAVVQGRLAGRWGASTEIQQAADRLLQSPIESCGLWQLEDSHELGAGVQEVLECQGYSYCTYLNRSTGDVVNVAVILGPPGPIAVHTPEICYSSKEYKQTSHRRHEDLPEGDSLWSVSFRSNSVDAQSFAVYYGWSDGDVWHATYDPRFEYAGSPYLYKLQLAGRSNRVDADADHEACRRFLEAYLPQLKSRLLSRGSQQASQQG